MSHYKVTITRSDSPAVIEQTIPFESSSLHRCGVGFDPSADPRIDRINLMFAAAMHEVEMYRDGIRFRVASKRGDGLRFERALEAISFAGNQLESAQMFAAKAYVGYKKAVDMIEAAEASEASGAETEEKPDDTTGDV